MTLPIRNSLKDQVSNSAPLCEPFDPFPTAPRYTLPTNSCDTHAHICGPASRYQYDPSRIYTPPDALLSDYLAMLKTLGINRAVIIQPSVYGIDNTVTLEAIKASPIPCHGVAVIDSSVTNAELQTMHDTGIRGIRLNLVDVNNPSGEIPLDMARKLAELIAPLGWHVEFLIHIDDYPNLDEQFTDFPTDIVVGHMGYMRPGKTTKEPGFKALLKLMEKGQCWVKLTGPYRISSGDMPYPGVLELAQTLVATAPERILWGSDWPHVMLKKPMPNDGILCDLLINWIPENTMRHIVLVDNPAKLYGF